MAGALQRENAAQYAGNAGYAGSREYAGNANINATNLTAQKTLSGAGYLANTQIGAGQAQAQGDLGAASAWNGMLGGIGSTLNSAAMMGFGAGGNWNVGNIGTNFGNMMSGGGYGGYGGFGGYSGSGGNPNAQTGPNGGYWNQINGSPRTS